MVNKKLVNNEMKSDQPDHPLTIKERLDSVLSHRGWNKKKLSELAGVKQRTVSRWFSGESEPSKEALRSISEKGDVSILFLTKGIGPLAQHALWGHYAREAWTPEIEGEIYARINEILIATGMNKAKLAAEAGLTEEIYIDSDQWIGDGKYRLSTRNVERIAEVTGYSKDWIWYGKGPRLSRKQKNKDVKMPAIEQAEECNSPTQAVGTNGLILGGDVWQKRRTSDRQPTATQENLRWIVEWMNEYYGENPSQSMYLYEDFKDRYPSFREFVEKKRASGDPQAGLPGELSVNDKG